ncbi:hypothetical protein ACFQY7_04820 [Actinomadura luteofluorescens]|uniref:Core-binding (CB) domain-containing protein n=1 Tax=Actinomadura luteofluorescens TaxID=46163 RepID=A0A7Y9EBN3_9ACTN|nr:hypothetical protein [Actinomadura luteofluorescens]NYD44818.1 hypothetical protein [Actinomadura luteofluorescens]
MVEDLEASVKDPATYTVGDCVEDWLAKGLKGLDDDTVGNYGSLARKHVIPLLGKAKLADLRADDVDEWLDGLSGTLSTRSLRLVHAILKRAIRQAQARDMIMRNVAELVKTPRARPEGRAGLSPLSRPGPCWKRPSHLDCTPTSWSAC